MPLFYLVKIKQQPANVLSEFAMKVTSSLLSARVTIYARRDHFIRDNLN